MSLILNIDTALSTGSVSISENGILLSSRINDNDRDHAAWIHTAINASIQETGRVLGGLDAVAVSHGPGSYTGLRIGLATAKGICFALNIPLITIPSLEIMAGAALENLTEMEKKEIDLLCPLIDARRMEVYFALYDLKQRVVFPPTAAVVKTGFFDRWLVDNKILFFGNGMEKLKPIIQHSHAFYSIFEFYGALQMAGKSLQYYDNGAFADLSLSEPLYIKEFYDVNAK